MAEEINDLLVAFNKITPLVQQLFPEPVNFAISPKFPEICNEELRKSHKYWEVCLL